MESNKKTFQELVAGIHAQMERLNYLPSTISSYMKTLQRIENYAFEKFNTLYFTEEIGVSYLKERYNYPDCRITSGVAQNRSCIKKLGEFQLFGVFLHKITRTVKKIEWSAQDSAIINSYVESVQASDTSLASKKIRTHHIKLFYKFLSLRNVSGINEVTPEIISDYVKYMHGFSLVYVKHRLANLRYYFRYLYSNGFCDKNLSFAVPRIKAPVHANVPTLWKKEDIEKLLLSADRGNPTGKRNYAIICLVVNLGIRIRDLVGLKLEYLKWERKEFEFHQHKTGNKINDYPHIVRL